MSNARIVMPAKAQKGAIIEIKTLVQHPMETGHRRDSAGQIIPRDIINRMRVTYAGREVFRAELYPGVAANPYVAFTATATISGEVVFLWEGDSHFQAQETRHIEVV